MGKGASILMVLSIDAFKRQKLFLILGGFDGFEHIKTIITLW
jgi:hypothetical protein